MLPDTAAQEIANGLQSDPNVNLLWRFPPQAFLLPFLGSRTEQYIIIWLFLRREEITLRRLHAACLAALRAVHERGWLEALQGVEIVPCVGYYDLEPNHRILRLLVRTSAVEDALRLKPEDLRRVNPASNICCGWYWEPDAISVG